MDNCQKEFTLKHKKQNMNTTTTKSTESIIKEFSDYTLNNEIENKYWILAKKESVEKFPFQETISIWKEKLEKLGGKYLLWSNSPENPQHN